MAKNPYYRGTLNISETAQDRHGYCIPQKVICGLLNCAIVSDLDRHSGSFQLLLSENVYYTYPVCGKKSAGGLTKDDIADDPE